MRSETCRAHREVIGIKGYVVEGEAARSIRGSRAFKAGHGIVNCHCSAGNHRARGVLHRALDHPGAPKFCPATQAGKAVIPRDKIRINNDARLPNHIVSSLRLMRIFASN